jgi:hypothetical protein
VLQSEFILKNTALILELKLKMHSRP